MKKKVILDTDPGLDDARALVMLLGNYDKVEIMAVTSCAGNVGVHQTTLNAIRILRVCDRLDIPIFKGSEKTFVKKENKPTIYHGKDGLGDVVDDEEDFDFDKYINKNESASEVILRIVKENEGEISLLLIGPLTNLALALKLDQNFGSYLKECVVMGGSYRGVGNVTPHAEYNFHADPEAVDYVLMNLKNTITLIPWELSMDSNVPFVTPYNKWTSIDTKKSRFLQQIGRIHTIEPDSMWKFCDEIAAGFVIDASIALESINADFTIKLEDDDGRRGEVVMVKNELKEGMVNVITKYDMKTLFKLFEDAMQ